MDFREWMIALLTGAVVGFLFAKMRLPAPAPLNLAGILGIAGIALGYIIGKR